MSTNPLAVLIERLLPESLEPILRGVLGPAFPRTGAGDRYRIIAAGHFRSAVMADLLAFARTQKLNAAMVLMEEDDTQRVLYFHDGVIVAADSNVLFERLGRILHKGGVIDKEDSNALVDCEEKAGLARSIELLPDEAARWGLERRVWEIGTSLAFMGHAHFVYVHGRAPLPGIAQVSIEPAQLAMEGLRRYDEWRRGGAAVEKNAEPIPVARAPQATPLDRAAIKARTTDAESAVRRDRQSAAPSPSDAAEAIMRLLADPDS